MLAVITMILAEWRFFGHIGITFSGVAKTTNCLVFLVVLLTEASLEPKNTFQLLLSAEISPLESGVDGKVPKLFGTKELMALSAPQPAVDESKMMKKIMKNRFFRKILFF